MDAASGAAHGRVAPEPGDDEVLAPPRIWVLTGAGLAAALCCVAALLLAGGRPSAGVPGLPDAGVVAGWALRATRLVFDAAGCLTVGSLLVGGVLVRTSGRPALDETAARATQAAGR